MDLPFGLSFNPTQAANRPGGTEAISPIQDAIKTLSLRIPRVVGAQTVAPAPLLNAPGAGGFLYGEDLDTLLRRLFGPGWNIPLPGQPPGAPPAPVAPLPGPVGPRQPLPAPGLPGPIAVPPPMAPPPRVILPAPEPPVVAPPVQPPPGGPGPGLPGPGKPGLEWPWSPQSRF